ncbi:endonuclease-reverse transcriptase [Plakobranchus ocellatus]|uniref:Endonuclease-reverse transcriptase n=1 Tax=Plakobranchus ocellatus TaxID=259542 RepID=A0AAV4AEJ0_9GAST|nr:endonuclease-reverse transcriptase [Plakobranchus ocellatus]
MERWREYGEELFRPLNPSQEESTIDEPIEGEPPPLIEEVEAAIKKLKNGKTPGLDNIPSELLKASGPTAIKAIHHLCCKIWNSKTWPAEWKKQEIVMLHKAGDPKDCGNYRTIALISHTSKIMLYIILERPKAKIENELAEEQSGFRPGRGTSDMLCSIQVMIEKVIESHKEAYIIFIDYSKAFDSVDHSLLFKTLTMMGFPPHLIVMIQSLYTNQEASIRWNNQHTESFKILKGVRQGCILSPHLFSLYTEQIMRETDVDQYGIEVGGRKISNLRYADDTALFAKNHEEASKFIEELNKAGVSKSLKLNAKKTKYLYIGKNHQPISFEEENIEKVNTFKYLGSLKTDSGDNTNDINAKIGKAKKRMQDLVNIWKDKTITLQLKIKTMKTLVWTVMTYGAEGWTIKKKQEKKINSAEMWFYRRLLRISWRERRTDQSILEELNEERKLLNYIKKRKLTFFGHTCRSKCT